MRNRAVSRYHEDGSLRLRPGRICQKSGCGRKLSVYNPYSVCLCHRSQEIEIEQKPVRVERATTPARLRHRPIKPWFPMYAKVLSAVCRHFDVDRASVVGDTNKAPVVKVRHVACYLMYTDLKLTHKRIGKLLCKDHTTSMLALRKVSKNFTAYESDILAIKKIYQAA